MLFYAAIKANYTSFIVYYTEQVITYLGGLSGKKIIKKDLDQICKMLRSITSLQKLTVDNKIKLIEIINVFLKEAELDAGSLVTIFNLIVKSPLFNTANYPYKQRHSDVSKQLISTALEQIQDKSTSLYANWSHIFHALGTIAKKKPSLLNDEQVTNLLGNFNKLLYNNTTDTLRHEIILYDFMKLLKNKVLLPIRAFTVEYKADTFMHLWVLIYC